MSNKENKEKKIGAAMVLGGGIGGMQAALDLAESGIKVYLVDNKPSIGGVMAQLDKTFPTNDCAMCTMAPRLVDIGRHKDIEILTLSDIKGIRGEPGNFTVTLNKRPRYVDEDKCTGCGSCVSNCPVHNQSYVEREISEIQLEEKDLGIAIKILEKNKGKKKNIIAVLQDIDAEYHYLPEFIMRYISIKLDIPLSQIYNIATFFSAFSLTPRGKYIISVCLGTACHVKGAPRIMESLERELGIKSGETASDLSFSLEPVRCLGCCGLAPVITINEDVHGKLTPAAVSKVLRRYKGKEVKIDA